MPVSITCRQCGGAFSVKPKDSGRKFCNFRCYKDYERIHGRESRAIEPHRFQCKVCSAPFERNPGELRSYRAKFGRDPLYCSVPCSSIGRKQDNDGRETACVVCGIAMVVPRKEDGILARAKRYCSSACRKVAKRAETRARNAGKLFKPFAARHGYLRITVPSETAEPSRVVLHHRYVMEKRMGRPLHKDETVHHKNGDRTDNSLENLELFSSRHGPGQRVTDKVAFAIQILTDYPEFAREAGARLVMVEREDQDHQAPKVART